ncbi:MAG: aspartate aminotransferase family protein [Nocardioides sp.]|uniref:aspartate aminotransferase family protein n=1 Tax=Nocardioides sp. TaxID=35761 RepID=UPI0039E3429B
MAVLPQVEALAVNAFTPDGAGALSPRAAALIARREAVLGPAYHLMYRSPVELVRGEGVWLWDADGRRYLDCYNNVASVGHANPRVAAAVTEQLALINSHTRYLHESVVAYAEELVATFPGALDTLMLTCTGSESNDLAIRIARHRTGNQGVIVTRAAYHGNSAVTTVCSPSMGPAATAGVPWIRVAEPPDAFRFALELGVVAPASLAEWWADEVLLHCESLASEGIGVAALLVDTSFSSDGVLTDPAGFLAPAAEVVRSFGGVLIADEVQPGFGRLGESMWGFSRHGVEPELVTLGKPMGNGMPIGGVVGRRDVIDGFGREVRYFNTFGGGEVAVAAGSAVLAEIRERGLIENARLLGERMRAGVRAIAERSGGAIGDVRGAGLFTGAEFVRPGGLEPDPEEAIRVVNAMREAGVLISATGYFGNTLKIRPPLVIDEAGVDFFLDRLGEVVAPR